jgi:hypothetical protein
MNNRFQTHWILSIFMHALLLGMPSLIHAQENTTKALFEMPKWVSMIDDSLVNYYEVQKEFTTFWKNRIRPEEDAAFGQETDNQKREREEYRELRMKMNSDEIQYDDLLIYHHKRCKNWLHEMKPYVQIDGRVLTMHERMQIWNRQKEELKK